MPLLAFLLILVLCLAVLPHYPYSTGWGYAPSGVLGTILIVLVILAVLGKV